MKPRRDITLGEMQDECKRKKTCQECDYKEVCPARSGNEEMPGLWNLTDPPRFNEAQMDGLRKSYDSGIRRITKNTLHFLNLIHLMLQGLGLR